MASGSHVCSGICADFATAPPSRPSATRFATVELYWPPRIPKSSERHRRVADRVHHERLLRGGDRARPLVPEADQQVRREADHSPAGEQQQQVAALDEQQHREHEQRDVAEVAALLGIAVHVADRVPDDQRADTADDEHHEDRERVDQDL
jgi:hypothetical protein